MGDVLDLYAEPYDERWPVVNSDEKSKQLVAGMRTPIPAAPGRAERYDYEYRRGGVANLFAFCEARAGWRHFAVTERHTKQDFAEQMKWLVDEQYPQAEKVRVVLDNLSTHKGAALYERFAPDEARRILRRLEFHYTPKHGSWLNLVEIELSVLQRQCLSRRIPDTVTLEREVAAYEARRNEAKAAITWNFSVEDARRKLKRLYPSTPL
jgi:DDE superfamily endonuclease